MSHKNVKTVLVGDEKLLKVPRPDVDDAYVVYWPEANLVIPWPRGKSVQEAVNLFLGRPTNP